MKIEFEQQSPTEVLIFGVDDKGRSEIGRIHTPSGSGENILNAIQICGFDEAFDLWGCGVYGDAETGKMKKDIQLMWTRRYKMINPHAKVCVGEKIIPISQRVLKDTDREKPYFVERDVRCRFDFDADGKGVCHRCYNFPCNCDVHTRFENPFTVKRQGDLWLDKIVKDKEGVDCGDSDGKI